MTFKGKGQKGKGKQKGKGRGDWFNAWNWAGRWTKGGKSKGTTTKGKGKQKGKSKGKGKQQSKGKGKAKGKLSPDRCRICGEWGHWGNECPQREVREVREASGPAGGQSNVDTRVPSSSPTTYSSVGSTTASTQRAVCRVCMYHVATPPLQFPERYALSEVSSNEDWATISPQIRAVTSLDPVSCQVFCMSDETDMVVCAESLEDDPFCLWLRAEPQSNVVIQVLMFPYFHNVVWQVRKRNLRI